MVSKKKVARKSVGKKKVVKKPIKKKVTRKIKRVAGSVGFPKTAKCLPKRKSKDSIERVPTGIMNLDKIIEGGLEKNSTNLLVGGSGNGKSIFATQFLIEGLKKGEAVLYVSFEEKKKEFYINMKELGWDLEEAEKKGKFFFFAALIRPSNNGAGFIGLDLNSGCAWVATKYG